MFYPRTDEKGKVISDNQMVGSREHMTNKHRVLFMTGVLTGDTEPHNLMMTLDSLSHDPIKLVITSPGGDLDATFLFYDTMRLMKSPIITVGRYCASAAALLLAAGTKRYLLPHAKVMLHLPSSAFEGDTKDIDIQHQQVSLYKEKMVDILINCGVKKSKKAILKDLDRDFWLEPEEAIKYGLADYILDKQTMESWLS